MRKKVIVVPCLLLFGCSTPQPWVKAAPPGWSPRSTRPRGNMRLPGKTRAFYISVSLALLSVMFKALAAAGVILFPTGGYLVLLAAYLVLLAGVSFKGV
jgi:hypothetical protein